MQCPPLEDLALAVELGRRVVDAACEKPESCRSPYQKVVIGWARLATKQAEGLHWALKELNKPVAMSSLRAITDMIFGLDAIRSDPNYQEYRSQLVLLEAPFRQLAVATSVHAPASVTQHPLFAQGIQLFEQERDMILADMAKLPRAHGDPDRWRNFPVKKRADLGNLNELYAFVYEMGSGYAHSDGYAIVDSERFSVSDQEGIFHQGMLYYMALVEAVLIEYPGLDQAANIVTLWNHWVERRTQGDPVGHG